MKKGVLPDSFPNELVLALDDDTVELIRAAPQSFIPIHPDFVQPKATRYSHIFSMAPLSIGCSVYSRPLAPVAARLQ